MSEKTPTKPTLSRRQFLQAGAVGLAALLAPAVQVERALAAPAQPGLERWLDQTSAGFARSPQRSRLQEALQATRHNRLLAISGFPQFNTLSQGRVSEEVADVRSKPDSKSERVRLVWQDTIVPLTEVIISEDTSSHNLVWYKIGDQEYIHSGVVQPVRTQLNAIDTELPPQGALAEVTVPFTDARRAPSRNNSIRASAVVYRFYYETTHWVLRSVEDEDGSAWYAVLDDKWKFTYYVPAAHLRIIPNTEVATLSPATPPVFKKIVIYLPEQVLVAYEREAPLFMARIASGGKFRDGDFSTPPGNYLTFHKRPSRHMAAGDLASNGYDLPGVPWISYITKSGIAIHGTYWHNNFGRPRSHGCINLISQASKWVYRWSLPAIPPQEQVYYGKTGTSVEVIGAYDFGSQK